MTTQPARNLPLLLGTVFIAVIGVLVIGAWWFKQTEGKTYVPMQEQPVVPSENPVVTGETATLKLIPASVVGTTATYQVVLANLTDSPKGIAFELKDAPGGTELLSSTFSTESSLSQQGWT